MLHKRMASLIALVVMAVLLGTVPLAAQDKVTIVWFVGLGAGGQPEQIEAQNQVVADFNASHPNIELQIQIADNNVAYDTLATLIASEAVSPGQAPDIVGPVGSDGSNGFAGNYLDIQPLVDAAGYDLSQFPESAVNAYRLEGQGLLGLPFATFPTSIYFRRSLFDEAGLPYPPSAYGEPYIDFEGNEKEWNMETLRELATMLTVDTDGADATQDDFNPESIAQWGFVSQWNEPRGESTLFGSNILVDADGNAQLPTEFQEAMNWFYNGIWVDRFIPNAAQSGSDLLAAGNAFSSGAVAMAHTHLWYTCCIGEGSDWDIAPVPVYNGVATAKLHGDTFRIMSTTRYPAEAFEVLSYLVGEASPTLLQVYGGMPAREADQESFFAALDERFPQGVNWQVAVDGLAYSDSPNHEYPMPNYLKAKDRIGAFQTLYTGTPDLDINATMEELVADLQLIFDEVK